MIIFDLDGTLANIGHRVHLIDKYKKRGDQNWKEFHLQCENDIPILQTIALFNCIYHSTPVKNLIEIWSGRSDEVRTLTVDWLQRFLFSAHFGWRDPEHHQYVRLRMRPSGNNTPDAALKESWLDEAIAAGDNIEMVFDDRQRVVDMWRRRGIFCLQVAKGDY